MADFELPDMTTTEGYLKKMIRALPQFLQVDSKTLRLLHFQNIVFVLRNQGIRARFGEKLLLKVLSWLVILAAAGPSSLPLAPVLTYPLIKKLFSSTADKYNLITYTCSVFFKEEKRRRHRLLKFQKTHK